MLMIMLSKNCWKNGEKNIDISAFVWYYVFSYLEGGRYVDWD